MYIRFGIKVPVFVNLLIFKIKTTQKQSIDIITNFNNLSQLIQTIEPKTQKVFDYIVCEVV